MNLEKFFQKNPKVALAYSGGVDSSYLLYAGIKYGATIKPYYMKSEFQPEFELEDAYKFTKQLGVDLKVIKANILNDEKITSNPVNRCYYCKIAIFKTIKYHANIDGFNTIIDGTNASDDITDRPGIKALEELFVISPLREYGFTKDMIRQLSKEANLFTWDKPSYACLATRIPVGRTITANLLQRIEKSENALFDLGFTDFRVRVSCDMAKIQLPKEQMAEALNFKEDILTLLKPYFDSVVIDLETR